MTRKQALDCIKAYAAQGDTASAMRVYIENRVSFKAYTEACRAGLRLRRFAEKHSPSSLEGK